MIHTLSKSFVSVENVCRILNLNTCTHLSMYVTKGFAICKRYFHGSFYVKMIIRSITRIITAIHSFRPTFAGQRSVTSIGTKC